MSKSESGICTRRNIEKEKERWISGEKVREEYLERKRGIEWGICRGQENEEFTERKREEEIYGERESVISREKTHWF